MRAIPHAKWLSKVCTILFRFLDFLVHLPITIFRNISDLFEFFFVWMTHGTDDIDEDHRGKGRWWLTALLFPLRIPIWFFQRLFRVFAMPFTADFYSPERRAQLLWGSHRWSPS